MSLLKKHAGLFTDFYELTMAQGYFLANRKNTSACFDYSFRKLPFKGGFVVFAGLRDLLEILEELSFDDTDCNYLKSLGFHDDFLHYLRHFRFQGDIFSPQEGEIVFPDEPIVSVQGNIIECQIIETLVCNILNFESLIATKAARLRLVAGNKAIIDFGLRRAHGLGGIQSSKAAVQGGINSTSNVYSAMKFGLTASGTQAHSWIQSFDSELMAFRTFAKIYPESCILLVDTYDTLKSGIPNAIRVAKEMQETGHKLLGIRLDSGNLEKLSKIARKMLDAENLHYVKIVASNQLDEYAIKNLLEKGAPIDAFGVGTKLVTGKPDAALDGIYKLSMADEKPRIKVSEEIEKVILPGVKKLYRFYDESDYFFADGIFHKSEKEGTHIYHPSQTAKFWEVGYFKKQNLRTKVMEQGKIISNYLSPYEIAEYTTQRIKGLPEYLKMLEPQRVYRVGISKGLFDLRNQMLQSIKTEINTRQKNESPVNS